MSDALPGNRSRSTLSDVALMAGVSPSTVSLVLAGKAGKRRISEATHGRVNRAATALGYTPSLLHRSMRKGRTHVVSFYNAFRNRDWSDAYMDRLSAGVEHAGGAYGYDVLVHCNYARSPQETYGFLNGGFADGVILFGPSPDDPLLPLLRASSLPTVYIGPPDVDPTLSNVYDDVDAGMRLVAERLLAQGHRRIVAIVGDYGGVIDPTGRLWRLRENLGAAGVALRAEDVVIWNRSAPDVLAEILAMAERPTAVFVWHDRAAYRLLEACEAAGIAVPEELSIVGYDGLVWPSTSGHVLASVAVALDGMGRAAMRSLDRLVNGEPGPLRETTSVHFDPGTTLGPPDSTHRFQRRNPQ